MSTLKYLGQMLKSKTVWLGILMTIIPYIAAVYTDQMTMEAAIVNSIAGIAVILLRLITNKPISEK